jgi:hypothetical protein
MRSSYELSQHWLTPDLFGLVVAIATFSSGRDHCLRHPWGPRPVPYLRQVGDGAQLQLDGPLGTLTWSELDGGPFVLIGGDSGIAPMAGHHEVSAHQSTAPMALLCSNGESASVILSKPLEELDREHRPSLTHIFTRSLWAASTGYHRQIDMPIIDDAIGELASWSPAPQPVLVPGRAGVGTSGARHAGDRSRARQCRTAWAIRGNAPSGPHEGHLYLPYFPKRDWTRRQSESTLIY